jgi:hypothetical protein
MVERVREPGTIASLTHDIARHAFIDSLHEHVGELELGASRDRRPIRGPKRRQSDEANARILEREPGGFVASETRRRTP